MAQKITKKQRKRIKKYQRAILGLPDHIPSHVPKKWWDEKYFDYQHETHEHRGGTYKKGKFKYPRK